MNTNVQTHHSTGSTCGCGGTSPSMACGSIAGGTGNYVRPRFFAGQLLTEEDLQALSNYVVEKNRLHNRHFMGAGVVCGLDVSCHPCGSGKIIVHPGYALDCCGNDIVLSCKQELDVNALVRDLRQSLLGGYDCGDPCQQQASSGTRSGSSKATSKDKESRHYCLYVRYHEEETDPVTPYSTDEPCGQAVCEPSRVHEGFRFELRCSEDHGRSHSLSNRFRECIGDLIGSAALLANLVALITNPDGAAVAAVKEDLLDRLDRSSDLTDCALRAYVQSVAVPSIGTIDNEAAKKLIHAYMRLLRDCLCAAIKPPCPPCDDPAVLLACLEVKDCEVVDICNLERTFVLTAPSFRYWYGFLINGIGSFLEQSCCTEIPEPELEEDKAVKKEFNILAATDLPPTGIEKDAGSTDPLDLAALFKGQFKDSLQQVLGISARDFGNLEHMVGSLGQLTNHGVFDGVVPGLRLVRNIDLRTEVPKIVGEQLRGSKTVRSTVGDMVDEKVNARMVELKKGDEDLIASEVNKRINELVPKNKLAALDRQTDEIAALKRDLDMLRAKLADVKDKPAKPKGTPK